jgi:hypothetical protein
MLEIYQNMSGASAYKEAYPALLNGILIFPVSILASVSFVKCDRSENLIPLEGRLKSFPEVVLSSSSLTLNTLWGIGSERFLYQIARDGLPANA